MNHTKTIDEVNTIIDNRINNALSNMNKDNQKLKIAIDELIKDAELYNHHYGIAYSYWFKGVNEAHNNNYDEALNCFNKSLEMAIEYNYEKLMGASHSNIGNMYMMKGDLVNAINHINQNVEINKRINNIVGLGVCYSNLATIYGKYIKDTEQALDFCLKAEECYINGNAPDRLPAININIANCYVMLNDISNAILYSTKSVEYGIKENNTYYLAGGHQVLTTIYLKLKDFEKATYHLKECKKYFIDSNIKFNNLNLGYLAAELLYESGDITGALEQYLQLIEEFDQSLDVYVSNQIYKRLSIIYENRKDFENAFKYQKKNIELNDILFKEDTNSALQKQKVAFQTEKLENQYKLKLLKSEMDTLRAQMNPHFIFNSLNSINKFILKNETDEASEYLVKFSQLIRTVLDDAQLEIISLANEIETIKLYIQIESLRFKDKIDYTFELADNMYLHDIYLPPLVLQPYIENAIWHGLMAKEIKGNLTIKTYNTKDFYILEIDDDGIGRIKSNELKSMNSNKQQSYGLKVTQDRIHLFNESNSKKILIEVEDKTANNIALGTKIIFKFEH